MKALVYDAGVLVAADRNDRRVWAEHRVMLAEDNRPLVPSTVVAQVSRSSKQAQLRRFLAGCEIVSFDAPAAHRVGALLGRTGQKDVVDASVVELARSRRADVLTSDPMDLRRLAATSGADVAIFEV